MAPRPASDDPAVLAVEDRLFRALVVLRVVVLLNAVGLNVWRREGFEHPLAGAGVVLAMAMWTAAMIWAYDAPRRRTPWLLVADLAVAVAALASSPLVKGEGFNASVPGFWVMGALFAWAIHWHVTGGLVAAVTLSVVDLLVRDSVTQGNYGNVFLLLIGGPIVGYLVASLQRMAAERDRALRRAAADAERARLARAVHDGVLQVLALVQRRGVELGGQGADLARLAGEQERSLRSLIRQQDTVAEPVLDARADPVDDEVDLTGALERLVTDHPCRADLASTGGAVEVSGERAAELVAVVSACLDNVVAHAGGRAWVLLEAGSRAVTVTVRDDGPGVPDGRVEEAEAEGRLGVASSIRGRVRELGGTARLDTGPHGTTWELEVPR